MISCFRPYCFVFVFFLPGGIAVQGGEPSFTSTEKTPVILADLPSVSPWRLGVGYAPLLNTSADFIGSTPAIAGEPGSVSGPVFGDYDDGFVRPDISGDMALTSNWAYLDDAQYDPSGGGSLAFSRSAGGALPGVLTSGDDPDDELGIELFAERQLGVLGGPGSRTTWGLHLGFHLSDLDASAAGMGTTATTVTTDRFPLGGVIPPAAPFEGSITGPNALLGTGATRSTSTVPGGASTSNRHELNVQLFSFNAGPWVAWELDDRWAVEAGAGVTVALADATYRYSSSTTLPGGSSSASSARGGETEVLTGLYAGASVIYKINSQWDVYASARFQYLDSLSVSTGTSRAEVSFDEAFVVGAGVRYKF